MITDRYKERIKKPYFGIDRDQENLEVVLKTLHNRCSMDTGQMELITVNNGYRHSRAYYVKMRPESGKQNPTDYLLREFVWQGDDSSPFPSWRHFFQEEELISPRWFFCLRIAKGSTTIRSTFHQACGQ